MTVHTVLVLQLVEQITAARAVNTPIKCNTIMTENSETLCLCMEAHSCMYIIDMVTIVFVYTGPALAF